MPTDWLDKIPLPAGAIRGGRFIYANEALGQLLGIPPAQVLGMDFFAPVVPEDRERVRERHARRLRGESVPDAYEFRIRTAAGEVRQVEILVALMSTGDVIFQTVDRTDRQARQANLTAVASLGAAVQRELTDAGIFQSAGAGLLQLGISTMYLVRRGGALCVAAAFLPAEVRAATEAALGGALVGIERPTGALSDAVLRDGAAYVDDMPLYAAHFVGREHGEQVRAAVRRLELLRGIGLRIDAGGVAAGMLLCSAAWLLPDDVPAFRLFATQVGAALDAARVVGDLSRRNAQLAAINQVASAAGTAADLDSLFARGAAEVRAVLGCVAVAVYLVDESGAGASLVFHQGGLREAGELFARVPLAGSRLGEVVHAAAPRTWQPEQYTPNLPAQLQPRMARQVLVGVPLISRGKVVGVMIAAFDQQRPAQPGELESLQAVSAHFAAALETTRLVDDLRKSYAALAQAQAQLVQRERLAALGELAAAVAHEVRNPLGVIFNSLGALRKRVPDERESRLLLDILGEEAERLNHIVGDLLDFARPMTPVLRPEALDALVDDAIDAALGDATPGVRVVRDYAQDLPAVPMDPRLLRQAVLNLVLNAVQAMGGAGTLRVSIARDAAAARDASPGAMACVAVSDTGAGIPAEIQARVFEPFFTTRATGTGLGLAVVKRIVEGHRGDVAVVSAPGAGTTATIRLPLAAQTLHPQG